MTPRPCATPSCQRRTERPGNPAAFRFCIQCTERVIGRKLPVNSGAAA